MTGNADIFNFGFDQDYSLVLRWEVARFALLFCERVMREFLKQFGAVGLVRIVAFQTVSFAEGLSMMSIHESSIFHIVAVETKSWRCFPKVEQSIRVLPVLMADMAAVATQVKSRMAATLFGDVHAGVVARQAQILFSLAGDGLQKLVLVVRSVRIMT